ncbi:hypothetical protein, partial [Erythrobacter donghaensis]|uniref:hypothetical protein n=1 Tax=Erythrobacter donghaensis TaxID=267135 RepID=UPI001E5DBEE9
GRFLNVSNFQKRGKAARPLLGSYADPAHGRVWVDSRMAGSEQKHANDAPVLNRRVNRSDANGVHRSIYGPEVTIVLQDTVHCR